jgi:hypothetical protein
MNGLQQSMAKDFQGFLLEADAMGEGALGNTSFSQWTRLRIEATWLWLGLVGLPAACPDGMAAAGHSARHRGLP